MKKATMAAGVGIVVAATSAADTDRLPSFSWDRIPCYMHVRKTTAFTADEIRYIASFPLVTFEKFTGNMEFGSTEKGTVAAARAVKALSPSTKVLYYRNVIVHYGGYAANDVLADVPGAFLIGRDGNENLVRGRVPAYDLNHARVRDWWVASAKQVCDDPAIDGLFLDGNIKVLEPAYLLREIGREKKAALVDGYEIMMKETRRMLGPNKLILANVLRARFPDSGLGSLRAFDGSFLEGFETNVGGVAMKDYVAKGIAAFQEAARQGFIIAFTAGLGEEAVDDEKVNPERTDEIRSALKGDDAAGRRFDYLLAIFLICAEEHSYFLAHDGYDARSSELWMQRPPELDRPLGEPQGRAARSGYVYTREFAHASVRLDIEKKTGSILWRAP
jgi:hypothetical protein